MFPRLPFCNKSMFIRIWSGVGRKWQSSGSISVVSRSSMSVRSDFVTLGLEMLVWHSLNHEVNYHITYSSIVIRHSNYAKHGFQTLVILFIQLILRIFSVGGKNSNFLDGGFLQVDSGRAKHVNAICDAIGRRKTPDPTVGQTFSSRILARSWRRTCSRRARKSLRGRHTLKFLIQTYAITCAKKSTFGKVVSHWGPVTKNELHFLERKDKWLLFSHPQVISHATYAIVTPPTLYRF